MAVLGRLLISSAERLDLPDLLSIDSYTAGDFKYLLKTLVNDNKPYIIKGFDVIDPSTAIGTANCSIRVADSAVYFPGSSAGPFFYGLPAGDPNSLPLVPELRKNAVNYVYLTFTTFNTSTDSRAFWDPDKDGGVGGEFTQDVNTESVLGCQVNVSVGAFPANTIPIAKITVGSSAIISIEDARDMLFRLGEGGINPNPYAQYNWAALPSSSYERNEPPTIMASGGVNPFQGGDKNILSLKEWMDAVMTKLLELGGTVHWYDDTSTYSIVNTFIDSVSTTFKSKGSWVHDSSTPGQITWTEDLKIKITSDPREYILRAGYVQLSNEQVAYLDLQRNKIINVSDDVVSWTNGQAYVNTSTGSIGSFANLSQGDWIRRASDSNQLFLRVEQFYDSVNASGSVTTSANAKSIRISAAYAGPTIVDRARYDKGVYQPSDVVVSYRNQAAITSAGGNFSWLVLRSDVIENISNIVTTSLSVSISNHDGTKATVVSSAAHGLNTGDMVTITGSTNFNGTYAVDVESTTVFSIQKSGGPFPNETGASAYYATVTTAARSTPYGLVLESANHNFATNEKILIAGTTNYNGLFPISVVDQTHFRIPVGGAEATETSGTATLASLKVRAEQGLFTLVQGESGNISDNFSTNVKLFLGMTSDNQTYPEYEESVSAGTLYGAANFNSLSSDNVTTRLSNLTAMMADRAQDKTIKYLPYGVTTVQNTTSGGNQQLTFPLGATLTLMQPGSPGNAIVTLPNSSPGIQLATNQLAYVTIDRNNATTPSINITSISSFVVSENTFVIASRLNTTTAWLWDGSALAVGNNPSAELLASQDRTTQLIQGGQWSWDGSTLSWSSSAYVELAGVTRVSNQIAASSVSLPSDGYCAYVELNRASGAATLSVSTAAGIDTVPNDFNATVIARRVGNSVVVGNGVGSILLITGESKELGSGLSQQNRTLIGGSVNPITEATLNPAYSARGAKDRTISDSESALDAIASIDNEFDKYFGQFRIIAKTAGTTTRVRITGSDRVTFTGETITQQMSNLRVQFTGAEIDLATGSIYGGDSTQALSVDFSTPLGVNFTPSVITSGSYLWYSIAANPSGQQADGTLTVQFNVLAGTEGTSTSLATKPPLGGTRGVGYVAVQSNGALAGSILPVSQANVAWLGASNGGSGNGAQTARLFDPTSTTQTTGTVVVDGQTVNAGDLVLFGNLSANNNKIYKAIGSGTTITSWQPQFLFGGFSTPSEGSLVVIQEGSSFASALGTFTGSAWSFNKTVRYFNGADYWEQSSLITSTIVDNSTNTLFTVNAVGSENMIIDYSIVRNSIKETGSLYVTTDYTNVSVSTGTTNLNGDSGVTFAGSIQPGSSGTLAQQTYYDAELMVISQYESLSKRIGFWFTPANTGTITGVTFKIGSSGGDPSQDSVSLTANVYADSGGVPSAVSLGSDIASGALQSSPTNYTVPFGSPVNITAGNRYYVILNVSVSTPIGSMAHIYGASNSELSNYPETYTTDGGTTWYVGASPSGNSPYFALSGTVGKNIQLQYTSTSTGSSGLMKYSIKRWSDNSGGPAGLPSYSGTPNIGGVSSLNSLTGAMNIVAGSNVTVTPDILSGNIVISSSGGGGGGPTLLGPLTILDNQASPATLFTYSASSSPYTIIQYSILKNGSYRVGRLLIASNGLSSTSESDDFVETGTSGVVFSAITSGGNVYVKYTSTNTGASGTFKYYVTSWS
jgi:hypothetical protein